MTIQKLSLEIVQRMDDAPKLRIIKVDGTGFPIDNNMVDNLDARIENFEKFRPGTVIGLYDFFSDPDYYTKMYTIVNNETGVRINV
jgi:hypothetical protein